MEVAAPTLEGLPVSTGAEAGVRLYQDRAIDRGVTAALCPCLTGRSFDHSHKRVSQVKITYSLISSTAYKLYIYKTWIGEKGMNTEKFEKVIRKR